MAKCSGCVNGNKACALHINKVGSCKDCQAGKSVKCMICKGTGQR